MQQKQSFAHEVHLTPDPTTMKDPDAVRRLMANATRLERADIVEACRHRLFELAGMNADNPIEKRLWQAVAAYEETLRQKHGRVQRASYTRRKIASKGAIQTLTDWAMDPSPTPGFAALVKSGGARFTGEYIVLEFAQHFHADAVRSARRKLQEHDFIIPPEL